MALKGGNVKHRLCVFFLSSCLPRVTAAVVIVHISLSFLSSCRGIVRLVPQEANSFNVLILPSPNLPIHPFFFLIITLSKCVILGSRNIIFYAIRLQKKRWFMENLIGQSWKKQIEKLFTTRGAGLSTSATDCPTCWDGHVIRCPVKSGNREGRALPARDIPGPLRSKHPAIHSRSGSVLVVRSCEVIRFAQAAGCQQGGAGEMLVAAVCGMQAGVNGAIFATGVCVRVCTWVCTCLEREKEEREWNDFFLLL